MAIATLLLFLLTADESVESLAKQMLPIYLKEAGAYTITAGGKDLAFRKEPILEWSNPARSGVQQGVIFLWLREGRPSAIASIFSQPDAKFPGRRVIHELHALDPDQLQATRPAAYNEWKPTTGLARTALSQAGNPANTPGARLIQMRRIAGEFSGHSMKGTTRDDLRLLPAPLYRYPSSQKGIIDGALFTLVSTTGTDPEILLVIEVREEGGKTNWQYACARFSDRSLYAQYRGKDVWSSVQGGQNTVLHDPEHLYRLYADKIVDLDGKVLAHVRATDEVWWGQVLPVGSGQ